jgi:hypothetical protein
MRFIIPQQQIAYLARHQSWPWRVEPAVRASILVTAPFFAVSARPKILKINSKKSISVFPFRKNFSDFSVEIGHQIRYTVQVFMFFENLKMG